MSEGNVQPQDPAIRQEVRAFTKDNPFYANKRKSLAESIRRARKDRDWHSGQIESTRTKLEAHSEVYEGLSQDHLALSEEERMLQSEMNAYDTQLVKRVSAFFRPQLVAQLRAKHTSTIEQLEQLTPRVERSEDTYQRIAEDLQKQHQRKMGLPNQLDRVDEFYKEMEPQMYGDRRRRQERLELDEYKPEHGTIEKIGSQLDVYFVHATHPTITGPWGNNIHLSHNTTWENKIATVLSPNAPALSVSSIKPRRHAGTWANIGVVLNGGVIEDSSANDFATGAMKDGTRVSTFSGSQNIKQYQEAMFRALAGQGTSPWNEFVVRSPQVAAMFINIDDLNMKIHEERYRVASPKSAYEREEFETGYDERTHQRKYVSFREYFETANKFGLPVVIFESGQGYNASVDQETGFLVKGEPVTPQDVIKMPSSVMQQNTADKSAVPPEALV